jgi:hypothetical protein
LRIDEACHLRIADIDSKQILLHVRHAKGGQERVTLLSAKLLDVLRAYWQIEKPRHWLFTGSTPAEPPGATRKNARMHYGQTTYGQYPHPRILSSRTLLTRLHALVNLRGCELDSPFNSWYPEKIARVLPWSIRQRLHFARWRPQMKTSTFIVPILCLLAAYIGAQYSTAAPPQDCNFIACQVPCVQPGGQPCCTLLLAQYWDCVPGVANCVQWRFNVCFNGVTWTGPCGVGWWGCLGNRLGGFCTSAPLGFPGC